MGTASGVYTLRMITLPIYPVIRNLVIVLATILFVHIGLELSQGVDFIGDVTLRRLFNVNGEKTFASWYASTLLFLCALVLAAIAQVKRSKADAYTRYWSGLAWIFVFLSLDEAASIHETLSAPVREVLNVSGFLHYAWVIPVAAVLLVLIAIYLRFYLHLPRGFKIVLALSAVLFIGGAMGLELPGAYIASTTVERGAGYFALTTAEETLEFVGVIVFLGALLTYLRSLADEVKLELR